ncbi:MAG TPA: 50S ribosomal protein L6, partial [Methanomethylovorans sp.]|nr:50S ribosomal protein L6 [Methanomethylovorans sp.]
MAKEMKNVISIPEGVTVTFQDDILSVSGPKGKNERYLWYPGIIIEVAGSEIMVDSTSTKKSHKAMIGTFSSHINNMMKGVTQGFEYRMKVVYSHFPIQLKVE